MIFHRYAVQGHDKFIWCRSKVAALSGARALAKRTPRGKLIEVESVTLAGLSTKALILAILNDEQDAYIQELTTVDEIKGRKKVAPPPPPPKKKDDEPELEMQHTERGYRAVDKRTGKIHQW